MTCMTLALLGNYAQTGHFGGPLAYTPYNVAVHLAGPDLGGLRHDYRRPKHPYGDKFMLAAGHCAPTCYALWMVLGEALCAEIQGDRRQAYYVAPERSDSCRSTRWASGAARARSRPCSPDQELADHPALRAGERGRRGIHALSGPHRIDRPHATTSTAGRPASGSPPPPARRRSGIWSARRWTQPKVIAFEGEFALCAGHAQELKTQALALKVGKRLRVMFSDNNAGIDDSLIGGVIDSKFTGYGFVDQWTSYGWNVLTMADGHDYGQIVDVLKAMEDWRSERSPADHRRSARRSRVLAGRGGRQNSGRGRPGRELSEPSLRDEDELRLLRRAGDARSKSGTASSSRASATAPVTDTRERLIQFKTNMDVAMSVLDKRGLGDWLADRLVEIGDQVKDDLPLRIDVTRDPFLDERLRVANLPDRAADASRSRTRLGRREGSQGRAVQEARRSRPARDARFRKSSSG